MPPELLRWYTRIGLNVAEGYGMTENLATTHLTVPGQAIGTVGKTYDGITRVVDNLDLDVNTAYALLAGTTKPGRRVLLLGAGGLRPARPAASGQ